VSPFISVRQLEGLERRVAYACRYRTMRESAKPEYLNHAEGLWIDRCDGPASIVFGAFEGVQCVGTIRLTYRRNGAFLVDEAYQWVELARTVGLTVEEALQGSALLDRGCVVAEWRRQGLLRALVDQALASALRAGCSLALIAVSQSNQLGMVAFEHLSFQQYGLPRGAPGRECFSYFKRLQ